MCVICTIPNNCPFETVKVKRAAELNRDGCGIARYDEATDRIIVRKGMWTPDEFATVYDEERAKGGNLVFHARIGTDGVKTELNCHPFTLLNKDEGDPFDLVLFHNGRFSGAPHWNKELSDTGNTADMLRPMLKAHPALLDMDEFQYLFRDYVGLSYNKVVLFDSRNKGQWKIINRHLGFIWNAPEVKNRPEDFNEDDYPWSSNLHSFDPPKPVVTTTYTTPVTSTGKDNREPWTPPSSQSKGQYSKFSGDYYTPRKSIGFKYESRGSEDYFRLNIKTGVMKHNRRNWPTGGTMETETLYTTTLSVNNVNEVIKFKQPYPGQEDLWIWEDADRKLFAGLLSLIQQEQKAKKKAKKKPLTSEDLVAMTDGQILSLVKHAPRRVAQWLLDVSGAEAPSGSELSDIETFLRAEPEEGMRLVLDQFTSIA